MNEVTRDKLYLRDHLFDTTFYFTHFIPFIPLVPFFTSLFFVSSGTSNMFELKRSLRKKKIDREFNRSDPAQRRESFIWSVQRNR